MGYIVRMPKLGVEMESGEMVQWHVDVGDLVEEGEVIAEIESEKATAEVTARESGTLRRTFLDPGESIEPGGPIGIVASREADIGDLEAEISGAGIDESPETVPRASEPVIQSRTAGEQPGSGAGSPAIKATPKAKKRASELGLSLSDIDGTGPQGAVRAGDVERAVDQGHDGGSAGADMTVRDASELGPTRRTIADRLGRSSREIPHVTVHREVDVGPLVDLAEHVGDGREAEVGLFDVLLAAVAATLDVHPKFNGTFEEGVHRTYEESNLAFAVDTDAGLLTPVISDIGNRSLGQLAAERRRLTDLALAGDHDATDLAGGTFTVSNLGVLGVDSSTPIIDPPQVAILGVGRIREQAVPSERGAEFRSVMAMSLSFDHRVLDGADAARFLDTLADQIRAVEATIGSPGGIDGEAER